MAISDKPWGSISPSDYADAADYCDACLIDTNPSGQDPIKGNCKLPVREPASMGGNVNRNALPAAAAVLAGARGGVDASAADKRSAARKLMGLYGQANMDAPPMLRRMAGMMGG